MSTDLQDAQETPEVVEAPAREVVIQTPTASALFMARRRECRLVLDPIYPIYGPAGQKVGEQPGRTVEFRDGRFEIPAGENMTIGAGRVVKTADIRKWLEGHRLNGDTAEGFWQVPTPTPAPSQDELMGLVTATGEGDEAYLLEFIRREESGFNRTDLIEVAQKGLEQIVPAPAGEGD